MIWFSGSKTHNGTLILANHAALARWISTMITAQAHRSCRSVLAACADAVPAITSGDMLTSRTAGYDVGRIATARKKRVRLAA
ncbi:MULTISPECIES: hypothetical protein [Cupriavidus]|uniref:hypothetical protein n=1 Tax=Cupriavidus TaxID=106589 RepID=UPI0011C071A1|nr:hypothetical protein [Cupriavidus taiwanensis]